MIFFSVLGIFWSLTAHRGTDKIEIAAAITANCLAALFSGHGWQTVAGEWQTCSKIYDDEAIMQQLTTGDITAQELQNAMRTYAIHSFGDNDCMGFEHSTGWRRAHMASLVATCLATIFCGIGVSVILLLHIPAVHKYLEKHAPAMEDMLLKAVQEFKHK